MTIQGSWANRKDLKFDHERTASLVTLTDTWTTSNQADSFDSSSDSKSENRIPTVEHCRVAQIPSISSKRRLMEFGNRAPGALSHWFQIRQSNTLRRSLYSVLTPMRLLMRRINGPYAARKAPCERALPSCRADRSEPLSTILAFVKESISFSDLDGEGHSYQTANCSLISVIKKTCACSSSFLIVLCSSSARTTSEVEKQSVKKIIFSWKKTQCEIEQRESCSSCRLANFATMPTTNVAVTHSRWHGQHQIVVATEKVQQRGKYGKSRDSHAEQLVKTWWKCCHTSTCQHERWDSSQRGSKCLYNRSQPKRP